MNRIEIGLTEIEGLRMGNAQNDDARTGVTVLLLGQGAAVGVDISGGGPASRETPLLSPTTSSVPVNAIVFSGGSAFGLDAATGVVHCLEEHGIGFDTGFARVPIVVQSCIYDLGIGSATIRPNATMGYQACTDALRDNHPLPIINYSLQVGAGSGATVGKMAGMEHSHKSGMGIYAVRMGDVMVGAIVVVNALGDVYDSRSGHKIAGMDNTECVEALYDVYKPTNIYQGQNTTIGAIVTNAQFDKAALTKIAAMTRAGYDRSIRPIGTLFDGDAIYCASLGSEVIDLNVIGTLAAEVMEEAVRRSVAMR